MLHQRIKSALVLLPIIILLMYRGGFLFALMIGLVAALALNEFFRMLSQDDEQPLILIGGAATSLFILNGLGLGDFLLPAGLAVVTIGGLLWELVAHKENDYMRGWALTIAGVLYIGWPLSLVPAIRGFQEPDGLYWLIVAAIGTWGCDSGAYVFGRLYGGKFSGSRRFSARWSPNKTWEGFFGGLLTCLLLTAFFSSWLLDFVLWQAILFGLLLGPAAVFGDLAESMLKRRVGVKDSGTLIPGHGGMLDRIDSTLFAAVVVYFFAKWIIY